MALSSGTWTPFARVSGAGTERGGKGTPLDAGDNETVTRLAGKVALITGGGTGIGRAIALAFAREGAKVAVAGRRREKLQETLLELQKRGGEGLAIECDVSKAKDAKRAVLATAKAFGKMNVLVNNAGVLHVSTIEAMSEDEWD